MVTTRRALLGAGALLLVGCGPPDEPETVPSEVWGELLRATQRAVASYPDSAAMLRSRASARVKQLEPMAAAVGAAPTAVPSLDAAVEAERAALQLHVDAVGELEDRASRELLGALIVETAQALTAIRVRQGAAQPIVDGFPGQRTHP